MEEVEYRSKDFSGQWVYGKLEEKEGKQYIIDFISGEYVEVQPELISKCTGLKDSEGNWVYIEDLLQNDRGDKVRIAPSRIKSGFCVLSYSQKKAAINTFISYFSSIEGYKIIGTTFETEDFGHKEFISSKATPHTCHVCKGEGILWK
jgi:hypothetical protein